MRFRRLFIVLGSLLALSSVLGAGSASAVVQRPLIGTFGPDGTAATHFSEAQKLGLDQANKRLYDMPMWPFGGEGSAGIYRFDVPTAGTYTPAGSPWPLYPIPFSGYIGGFTIDNSSTSTAGRLYEPTGGALTAWEPDGAEVGTPFPLSPGEEGRFCEAAVAPNGDIFAADYNHGVDRFSNLGVPLEKIDTVKYQQSPPCAMAFDSQENLFVASRDKGIWKFTAASNYTEAVPWAPGGANASQLAIDKADDHILVNWGNVIKEYDEQGNVLLEFGPAYGVPQPNFSGVAVNEATNEVYAVDTQIRVFGPPKALPKLTTERPKNVTTTGATLQGHVSLDGGPVVTKCLFQYSQDLSYSEEVPCTPEASSGTPFTGETDVSANVIGLTSGVQYHYRLVATTSEGTNVGEDQSFITADPPLMSKERILEVTADHALLEAQDNPRGVKSSWHIEYGLEDCATSECQSTETQELVSCGAFFCPPNPTKDTQVSQEIIGLKPNTVYHFRFVGENNQNGIGYGEDRTFRTFPLDPSGVDPCPNASVRKLTGAGKLSHCRAYELVSALDAGGYDVASNIVQGETPLPAYPQAQDSFLYTTSVGKLPGVGGYPVNLGTDPYIASRGSDGWTTKYVGLPATLPSDAPFASTLSGANAHLKVFAFGEPDRCSPCFEDGSTGIPLRLSNGALVQGMKGSIDVPDPEPAGKVAKPLSADGTHFIFGSEQRFEPAGNVGSVSIYDRNLNTQETQVVSTMPDGSTMTGEIAELDVSANGNRVLIGRAVGEDAEGNPYYDLYMHIGNNPHSVQVADTEHGVVYNGMSDDGKNVYFTTVDQLADDTDHSPDIFRAEVSSSTAAISRVSTGIEGTGNNDECEPPDNWNVVEGGPNCGALAFAGGAGVASGDGTIYFLSPEQLDGESHGLKDEPNIYVERPGSSPKYVGLLDDSHIKPPPSPPRRPVISAEFGGTLSGPRDLAVDEINGDVYVVEGNAGRIARFDANGNPRAFTAGPGAGTNKIAGLSTGGRYETAIGVDSAPGSPFEGDIYTRQDTGTINVYAPSGEKLGAITGFYEACGLAVDQATGDVYVGDWSYGGIRKFHPISNSTPVTNADYEETSIKTQGMNPCQVAAGGGYAYASQWQEGPLRRYPMSEFASTPPALPGKQVTSLSKTMYVDPSTGEVYVEQGNQIAVFTSDEEEEIPAALVGLGTLTNQSVGVAVNGKTHHVFATKGNNIVHFGFEEVPYLLIDQPGVLHATEQPYTHSSEDFQVSPNGEYAVFASKVVNTEKPTDDNYQVYRYNAASAGLDCVSCSPTGAVTTGDAFLSPNGTNLSDDGRVFFTSPDQLTLRDTNRRTDAYEWDEGKLNLISTGTGVVNAALASVDSTGKDAYFFTRESIVPQDENGPTMKVYDAREGGGFPYAIPKVPCQAADECRGPGTPTAPPPAIGTYKGTGGNVNQDAGHRCRRGFVRLHGRCVKRGKRTKHHRRSRGGRRG